MRVRRLAGKAEGFLSIFKPGQPLSPPARRVVIAVFWLEVAVLLWAASFGGGFQGQVTQLLGVNDKVVHALAFALLAMTGFILWNAPRIVVPALLALALAIEAMQSLVPGRTPSLWDFAASAAGIAVGAVFWWAGGTIRQHLRNGESVS